MLRDVVLVREERADTAKLQDALAAVHDGQLILAHEFLAGLLIVETVGVVVAAGLGCVVEVDGLLAEDLRDILQSGFFLAAEKKHCVAVARDRVRRILVDRLQLGLGLQNNRSRDFPAPDGGDQFIEFWDLADVSELIQQTPYVHRQPPAVFVVGLVAKEIEKLRVQDGRHEVERVVRVADDDKQGGFPVSDGVECHFVIAHQVPQLRDIEGSEPRAAGDQDRLCRLARRKFVFPVLFDGKVFRVPGLQFVEHHVHGVLEGLVLLPGFGGVDHLQKRCEVLLAVGSLVPYVADERRVVKLFSFHPEILAGLVAVSLRIDDDGIDQLEDVLLGMDVGEGIVVHGLFEVDGVEGLDRIAAPGKHPAALDEQGAFGIGDDVGTVHLHEIRLHIESRFAAAGAADDHDVFVAGVFRLLRAA